MAKIVKKHSKTFLVLVLMVSLVGLYVLVAPTGVKSASLGNREVKISDSRPAQTGVTYDFEADHSASNVSCIRVSFCNNATGTCTAPTGLSASSATTAPTASWAVWTTANWTLASLAATLTYTNATGEGASLATQNRSFVGGNITNPTSANTYFARINTYSNTGCTTAVDDGVTAFAIISGISVTATVAETLNFAIAGTAGANCAYGTDSTITTTATQVPFGELSATTFYRGCSRLTVTTNAGAGYSMTSQEDTSLKTASNVTIADTACDGGSCTATVSSAANWTNTAIAGFGYTCAGARCNSAFSSATGFVQYSCMGSTTTCEPDPASGDGTPQVFASYTAGAVSSDLTTVVSRVNISGTQAAGSYSNTVIFVATPTYQ